MCMNLPMPCTMEYQDLSGYIKRQDYGDGWNSTNCDAQPSQMWTMKSSSRHIQLLQLHDSRLWVMSCSQGWQCWYCPVDQIRRWDVPVRLSKCCCHLLLNLEWCMARCASKSGHHKDMSLRTSNDSRILNHLRFIVNISFLGRGVGFIWSFKKKKRKISL